MRGGNISDIAPGNAESSRLYLRLIGRLGAQMPPTGALNQDAINTIKAWIDQGAVWPDELAGDMAPPPADPDATRLMAALRAGDRAGFERLLPGNARSANRPGQGGATPLMYAALYGDARAVQLLLDSGADPNVANMAGATALMWAVTDLGKTQVLVDYGADVNARSDDGRTPIAIAAGLLSGGPVVNLLLEYGAKPSPRLPTDLAPLREAARIGDAAMFKAMLDHGADPKGPGAPPAAFMRANCPACAEIVDLPVVQAAPPPPPGAAAPPPPPAYVPGVAAAPRVVTLSPAAVRAAIERSVPLLQKNGASFIQETGCVSCHQNSVMAMAIAAARKNGYRVDESMEASHTKAVGAYIESWRDRALQGIGIAGGQDSVSYIMFGLISADYPSDAATDGQAYFLKMRQSPDGRWRIAARRPPIESNDIEVTALSMRTLQIYGLTALRADFAKAVERARGWLATAKPESTEERAFRLLGLHWGGAGKDLIALAARELVADQRPDGGWAQIPTLASDAYATGQALVALRESGMLAPPDPAFKRGAEFLLGTQLDDGSWQVTTRANPVQPFFESGFPHGRDQWISAAATGWATTALALSR